jgi:hypothetical protein
MSGRLGISRIIAGLSLFNRALKQGGDEVKSFSARITALGTTETIIRRQQVINRDITKNLETYFITLKNRNAMERRFSNYSLEQMRDGSFKLYEAMEDGSRVLRRGLQGIPLNELVRKKDDLVDFLGGRFGEARTDAMGRFMPGLVSAVMSMKTITEQRRQSSTVMEKFTDETGLMKQIAASPLGSLISQVFPKKKEVPNLDDLFGSTKMPDLGILNTLKGMGKIIASPLIGIGKTAPTSAGGTGSLKGGFQGFKDTFKSGIGDLAKGSMQALALPVKGIAWGGRVAGKGLETLGRGVSRLTGIPTAKLKEGGAMFAKAALPMAGGFALGILIDVVMQLLDALNPFKPLMEALTTIFGVYGAILSQAFTPLIEKLFEIMLSPAVLAMMEMLANAVMQLVIAFLPLLDILATMNMIWLVPIIISFQILGAIMNVLAVPLQLVGTVFQGMLAFISTFVANWQTYAKPVFDWISNFFTVTIPNIFKFVMNSIIAAINLMIGGINALIPGTKWDLATIPLLAKGGLAYGPQLAMVGDNPNARNDPEVIAPLSKLQGMGGGGVQITINGNITEEKLFQMRKDLLIQNIY